MAASAREKGGLSGSKNLTDTRARNQIPPFSFSCLISTKNATKGFYATSILRCFYRLLDHDYRSRASGAQDLCGPNDCSDPFCRGIIGNACLRSVSSVFDHVSARKRRISCFLPLRQMEHITSSLFSMELIFYTVSSTWTLAFSLAE